MKETALTNTVTNNDYNTLQKSPNRLYLKPETPERGEM